MKYMHLFHRILFYVVVVEENLKNSHFLNPGIKSEESQNPKI